MLRRESTLLFAVAVAFALPARADDLPKPMTVERTSKPGTVAASESEQVAAIVTAVDVEKRNLTLQGAKGRIENMHVGDEVRNLAQIKVGDNVVVRFQRGLVLTLQSPDQPSVAPQGEAAAGRAAAGEKPGGAVVAVIRGTVTVKEIDAKQRVVTLVGPEGREFRVKAGPDVRLEKVKVGDRVYAEYGEALAISVVPRKGPAAPK
jgi:hypothetical protein